MLDEILASGNYIVVNRTLIQLFGLDEALLIGELCSEYSYWKREDKLVDDMFFCTAKKLEDKTTLSEYRQRNAIKHLEDLNVLRTELKGVPPVRYFYIDEVQILKNLRFNSLEIKDLNPKKFELSNNINNKTINNKNNISLSKDNDICKNSKFLGSLKVNKELKEEDKIQKFLALCEKYENIPKVRKIAPKRRKAILHILNTYTEQDIEQVLNNFNTSDFLLGKATDFKAGFDWMLNENNFVKILEGNYNNRVQKNNSRDGLHSVSYTEEELEQIKEENKKRRANGLQTKF